MRRRDHHWRAQGRARVGVIIAAAAAMRSRAATWRAVALGEQRTVRKMRTDGLGRRRGAARRRRHPGGAQCLHEVAERARTRRRDGYMQREGGGRHMQSCKGIGATPRMQDGTSLQEQNTHEGDADREGISSSASAISMETCAETRKT